MDLEKRVVSFIWLEMRRRGGGEHSPKVDIMVLWRGLVQGLVPSPH